MKRTMLVFAAVVCCTATPSPAQECSPQDWKACKGKPWVIGTKMDTPVGEKWWPNTLWGADDEAGATNWYTKPEVIQRAFAEAKTGKVYRLGPPYTSNQPSFGSLQFVMRLIGAPTGGPFGANNVVYNDKFVATEIGQTGTQFDGLGHIGVAINGAGDANAMRYYNGFTEAEIRDPYGLKKLGVEKLHPVVARGVLLDIADLKGVDAMEAGQEIAMSEVRAALKRQGMDNFKFMPGDVVLFRTGWGKYWIKDNAKYMSGAPGIGMEIAKWLSDDVKAGVVGSDAWPVEVVPNPDKACAFCVHTHLILRHGILLQESMDLDALARDRIYTFLYAFSPVPIVCATGSPGAPLAIK